MICPTCGKTTLTEQPHVHTGYLPRMGFGTGGNRLIPPTHPQLPGDPDPLDGAGG